MEKREPFFAYMMERKLEVQNKLGRSLPLCELAFILSPNWQAMSESEKERYRGTKNYIEKLKYYTSNPQLRGEEQAIARRNAWEMEYSICKLVRMYKRFGDIRFMPFYVVSGSYYLQTDEGFYVPAEISLLRFTFKRGIIKQYHAIIKPFIPKPHRRLASEHSQATHNLLPKDDGDLNQRIEGVAKSQEQVAEDIKKFLREDPEYKLLYTLEREVEQMHGILRSITGEMGPRVYSLEMLLETMLRDYVSSFPNSINTWFKSNYSYQLHGCLACTWHASNERDSSKHCTMSLVKDWVFLICWNVRIYDVLGIVPQAGKHFPENYPTDATGVNTTTLVK